MTLAVIIIATVMISVTAVSWAACHRGHHAKRRHPSNKGRGM
jgi:fatty-acid desaturase